MARRWRYGPACGSGIRRPLDQLCSSLRPVQAYRPLSGWRISAAGQQIRSATIPDLSSASLDARLNPIARGCINWRLGARGLADLSDPLELGLHVASVLHGRWGRLGRPTAYQCDRWSGLRWSDRRRSRFYTASDGRNQTRACSTAVAEGESVPLTRGRAQKAVSFTHRRRAWLHRGCATPRGP